MQAGVTMRRRLRRLLVIGAMCLAVGAALLVLAKQGGEQVHDGESTSLDNDGGHRVSAGISATLARSVVDEGERGAFMLEVVDVEGGPISEAAVSLQGAARQLLPEQSVRQYRVGATSASGQLILPRQAIENLLAAAAEDERLAVSRMNYGVATVSLDEVSTHASEGQTLRIVMHKTLRQTFRFEVFPGHTPFEGALVAMSRAHLRRADVALSEGLRRPGSSPDAIFSAISASDGAATCEVRGQGEYRVRVDLPWPYSTTGSPQRGVIDVPSGPVTIPVREIWASVVTSRIGRIVAFNAAPRGLTTRGSGGLLSEAIQSLKQGYPGSIVTVGFPSRDPEAPHCRIDALIEGHGWVACDVALHPLGQGVNAQYLEDLGRLEPCSFGRVLVGDGAGDGSENRPAMELREAHRMPPRMIVAVRSGEELALPEGDYVLSFADSFLRRNSRALAITVRAGSNTVAQPVLPDGVRSARWIVRNARREEVGDVWLRVATEEGMELINRRYEDPQTQCLWLPIGVRLTFTVNAAGYAEQRRFLMVGTEEPILFDLPWI